MDVEPFEFFWQLLDETIPVDLGKEHELGMTPDDLAVTINSEGYKCKLIFSIDEINTPFDLIEKVIESFEVYKIEQLLAEEREREEE